MTKLAIGEYPAGHGPEDFECFGPACTKDGLFEGTMIVDLGCFKQPTPDHPEGVDSNKYYHAAVVQSKKTKAYYAYFEYARTGAKNPQFQFLECNSKAEAEREYAKQCHSKNDKRGEWTTHAKFGKILQAKAGKDCYLVRPQATRSTGLPSARTIKTNEGAKQVSQPVSVSLVAAPPKRTIDKQTSKLLSDLNVATVSFTRGAMSDDSLPTQVALDEARDILTEALKRVAKVGSNVDDQVKDKELMDYTSMIYSRIPKRKERSAAPKDWILSQDNINGWRQDLDAFEQALYVVDMGTEQTDLMSGLPADINWIDPSSDKGKFLYKWWPNATRNKHYHIGAMKVHNIWEVNRHGDMNILRSAMDRISTDLSNRNVKVAERPLHQDKNRPDLSVEDKKFWWDTNTSLVFHGTRSVNVGGIIRENFRFPKELVGVVITGAMFGPGNYYADDWKKSAGYCSNPNKNSRSYYGGGGEVAGRHAFMFAVDVAMGNAYVAPRAHGYTAPPAGYHTVFGKADHSGVANNEWIIYQKCRQAIRYLAEVEW